jgi:hypothetical protein
MGMDISPLTKGLDAAQAKLAAFGKGVAKFGAGIAAAGATISAPFLYGLTVFADMGSSIAKAARVSGIGLEDLQVASYALKVSFEELTTMSKKMDQFISKVAHGAPEATQQLRELGIELSDLTDLNQAERLELFGRAINTAYSDIALRHAAMIKIFGKAALQADFSGDMGARMQRLRDLGGVMSPADVALAKEYTKSQKEMGIAMQGLWARLGTSAAPVFIRLAKLLTDVIVRAQQLVDANRPLLIMIFEIADKAILAGTEIGILGGVIYGASFAFSFLSGAVGIVAGLLTTVIGLLISPAFLTIAALGVSFYLLYQNCTRARDGLDRFFGGLSGLFSDLGSIAGDTIQGISDALSAGNLDLAAQIGFLGIKIAWLELTDAISSVWTTTINFIASALAQSAGGWALIWNVFKHAILIGWNLIVEKFSIGWNTFRMGAEAAFAAGQAVIDLEDPIEAANAALAAGAAREQDIINTARDERNRLGLRWANERDRITREVNEQVRIINAPGDPGAAAAARAERDRLRGQLNDLNAQAAEEAFNRELLGVLRGMGDEQAPGGLPDIGGMKSFGTFSTLAGMFGDSDRGETAAERTARLAQLQLNQETLIAVGVNTLIAMAGRGLGVI